MGLSARSRCGPLDIPRSVRRSNFSLEGEIKLANSGNVRSILQATRSPFDLTCREVPVGVIAERLCSRGMAVRHKYCVV